MKAFFISLLLLTGSLNLFAQQSQVLAAFTKHGIDPEILKPSIKQQPTDIAFDYKYTTTASDKQKVTLAHFDPNKSPEERWDVLSVNGKTPSSSEIKKFRKEKSKVPSKVGEVDENSMRVEKETADQLVVSYKLKVESLPSESAFLKDCINHLTINLKTKRLEKLQCVNEKTVKIKIFNAEKLDLNVLYNYNEQLKRYLPISEELNLVVKFLGQLAPIESLAEYSNYVVK